MAILESCCFWKNVRKGSYACATYTLIYFGISTLMFLFYLKEEKEFLMGQREQPLGESMLERGDVTKATVIFNILFLFCSMLMLLSSFLLILGLRQNKRQLLLPWIFFMLGDLLIEFAHLIHLTLSRRVNFDPIVGFIFTIDFFVLCLNLYCLLCVISQYQFYREQRLHLAHQPPLVSPNVVFTDAEKSQQHHNLQQLQQQQLNGEHQNSQNTNTGQSKRLSRRLQAASPLITSQRLTNFSTITEEEEQQLQFRAPANGDNGNGDCGHISERSGATSSEGDIQPAVEQSPPTPIPTITLDANSQQ
ncbi:uncharacterized protein Dwil_GK16662 [Drosophila willistoni]|uniref:Uncharacterized protein n=1 Tax=Drosophila willistoni TaxID=7260 RepID=B4MMK3_DROWI|nr:uncharacterized protein LOC6638653 [Drosophila willistoni]EDW73409.1 uncharacterized protein Dwil_GK16662 [Drosophila willistoni]